MQGPRRDESAVSIWPVYEPQTPDWVTQTGNRTLLRPQGASAFLNSTDPPQFQVVPDLCSGGACVNPPALLSPPQSAPTPQHSAASDVPTAAIVAWVLAALFIVSLVGLLWRRRRALLQGVGVKSLSRGLDESHDTFTGSGFHSSIVARQFMVRCPCKPNLHGSFF